MRKKNLTDLLSICEGFAQRNEIESFLKHLQSMDAVREVDHGPQYRGPGLSAMRRLRGWPTGTKAEEDSSLCPMELKRPIYERPIYFTQFGTVYCTIDNWTALNY